LFRSTGFRLALWYSAIFIISLLILHAHEHWRFNLFVRNDNRDSVMGRIEKYTAIEKSNGLGKLLEEIRNDDAENAAAGFFMRVFDSSGETQWLTLPQESRDMANRYLEKSESFPLEQWSILRAGRDRRRDREESRWEDEDRHDDERWRRRSGKDLDIYSRVLTNGMILQVGKTALKWDILEEHFFEDYIEVMIPGILLAVLGGIFLARRAMRPVRHLTETVQKIETGRMDARVPSSGSGGELDELVALFNNMLNRIETLVTGMREALDNVAHDLRTPLSRMKASIEDALQSDEDAKKMKESLGDCAEELEQIVAMLNALTDISEAETGAMTLSLEQINLLSLLAEVTEVYRHVAEDKNIDIEVSIPEELVLYADRVRIRQVMANLLDNSIKYTSEGQVKITARPDGEHVVVSFEDTGEGIAPEDIPRIFDRLYRGDRSRSRRGLGLGLSFVQAVVSAHNGRVEVESEPNRGSTFSVFLPATQNR
jgi:signal transduction histidine kinase